LSRILITGGTGFIGSYLSAKLIDDGHFLTVAHRSAMATGFPDSVRTVAIENIGPRTDWRQALEGCEVVVHLGAQVPSHGAQIADYDAINNIGTASLVEQSIGARIKRFIFLSSVSAVVESATRGEVSEKTRNSSSLTAYGQSKREAERHVTSFARDGRVGISIRPPLVYAFNAKGRWATLQRLAASRLPLPFGMVHNRRSLIAVENLVDALAATISVSEMRDVSGVYFVADNKGVSISDIVGWLREGMGLPRLLLPLPVATLRGILRVAGFDNTAQGILGDLMIDSTLFRTVFDWTPRLDSKEAIKKSGQQYRLGRRS